MDGVAPGVSQRTMGDGGPRLHWRYCVRKVEGEEKLAHIKWVGSPQWPTQLLASVHSQLPRGRRDDQDSRHNGPCASLTKLGASWLLLN